MSTTKRERLFALLLAGVVVLWPTLLWAHARHTAIDGDGGEEVAQGAAGPRRSHRERSIAFQILAPIRPADPA